MRRLAEIMKVRLRRPDGGNLCAGMQIVGLRGNIGKDGSGYAVAVMLPKGASLTSALARLSFAEVRQRGDSEAVLFMAALPTKEQACTLRKVLKVKKVREVSAADRERMVECLRAFRFARGKGEQACALSRESRS